MLAGEASGDVQAAYLVRALRHRDPSMEFIGVGASRMREAGVEILQDSSGLAGLGFVETVRRIPWGARALRRMRQQVQAGWPDLLVLVDFGVVNLRLGRFALQHNCPVLFYFPPGSWSSSERRCADVAQCCTRIATPFPQCVEPLRRLGADVSFIGHPLMDILGPAAERRQQRLAAESGPPIVALLPGSRDHEITHILPHMLKAARLMRREFPDLQFIVSRAHTITRDRLEQELGRGGVQADIVDGTRAALEVADVGLVKSGTATLEAAIMGVPMVVVYRAGRLPYLHYVLFSWPKPQWIAMPNLLVGREIVPELIQFRASAEAMASHALRYLRDRDLAARVGEELRDAVSILARGNAIDQACDIVFDMLHDARAPQALAPAPA